MSDPQQLAKLLLSQPLPPMVRNAPYVRAGATNFNTQLPFLDEMAFRSWMSQNKVPFNPDAGVSDYDMRGFWQGIQQEHPRALSSVSPNDNRMHYSDYWKTPYHETFSGTGGPYTGGSQWAAPVAPQWNAQDQLLSPGGKILFDERNR